MQKTTTSLNKSDKPELVKSVQNQEMQPTDETLNRIKQFAAAYRVQKTGKNQFVEMFLN